MSKKQFDKTLEALKVLRVASDSAATHEQLRATLQDRNNYLVARAAEIAAELKLEGLIPDLLAAFERFFTHPEKSDPHCWAKSAIAKALKDLRHTGAHAYLRGISHVQLEPAWGGRADSAASLRGTCALALATCQLDGLDILTCLGDGLADPETLVRIDSAMAIDQLGRPEGALLLRLKLLMGDSEPAVVGQCFTALLSVAPAGSVSFISRFLRSVNEDIRLEAASALAGSRDPHAVEVLEEFWREPGLSLALRQVLLINLGASPLPEAAEFLLNVIEGERVELAASALAALAASRFRTELRERIAAVINNPELKSIFEQQFGRTVQS